MTYALITGAAIAAAALLFCSAVMFRRAARYAWCELTGGHDNEVLGVFMAGKCRALRLHCWRCGKKTKLYNVPKSSTVEIAKPATE